MASVNRVRMADDLERQIARTRAAVRELAARAGHGRSAVLDEALEQLGTALEELDVTSEELQQQNEELRATQAELAAERRAYQQLFDLAPAPYLTTDVEAVIREANQASGALLGVPTRLLPGRPLALFVPEDVRAAFRRRLLALAAGDSAHGWEFPVRPRTGPPVLVTAEVLPTRGRDGEVALLRWAMRDVTDARRIQQALQEAYAETAEQYEHMQDVDRWKDAFLAAAAHDLRSPLSDISSGAETLLHHLDLDSEPIGSLVERILRQSRRLSALLNDLLDLDRFTRGAVRADRRPTEVRGLVERVVEQLAVKDHPIDVTGREVTAELDTLRVEQIVQNLVANAATHTPRGTPIRVDIAGDPDQVVLTVEDEGPGIPADVRDKLLLPFVSAASHDGDRSGTGIGLSLVDLFAQLHGGRVRVEDRPGGGARFVVELPGAASGR